MNVRLVYDRENQDAKVVGDKRDFVPIDVGSQAMNLSMLRYVVVDDDFYQDA